MSELQIFKNAEFGALLPFWRQRRAYRNSFCPYKVIAAGVKFFGGYPITPSTEVAESLAERLPLVGGKFIQL